MTRTLLRLATLCALAAPLPLSAQAASFACAKAESADEVAICADRELGEQDVELATRFEILGKLLPMGGSGKLKDDQEAWLKVRRACGGDRACLRKTYEARLQILRTGTDELAKRGPM